MQFVLNKWPGCLYGGSAFLFNDCSCSSFTILAQQSLHAMVGLQIFYTLSPV